MVDIDAVSENGVLVDGDTVLVVEISLGNHDTVLGTVSENKISCVAHKEVNVTIFVGLKESRDTTLMSSSHAVSNVDQNSKWPINTLKGKCNIDTR